MKYPVDREKDVLVIVDVQGDFCAGGALPVPEAEEVVPALNRYIKKFKKSGALVVATRDWHPPNHVSFKEYGGIWPPHCVQGTKGAEFHRDLEIPEGAIIVSKGTASEGEAYSGFDGTGLDEQLRTRGIRRLFVGGLATDYCVRSTVLDALELGFETVLLVDAMRGVDVKPGDSERAIKEMLENGARKIALGDLESG